MSNPRDCFLDQQKHSGEGSEAKGSLQWANSSYGPQVLPSELQNSPFHFAVSHRKQKQGMEKERTMNIIFPS